MGENNKIYKAAQYFHFSTLYFSPLIGRVLSEGESRLFAWLNYQAWAERDLIVRAAVPFLVKNTGISHGSVKRNLRGLCEWGLIRLLKVNCKIGNDYFIEPYLLADYSWTQRGIKNLSQSELVKAGQLGPNQWREIWEEIMKSGQVGPTTGPDWPDLIKLARTDPDQFGPQSYLLYSLLRRDATRQRCPNGQNAAPPSPPKGGNGKKGVAPKGDPIKEQIHAIWVAYKKGKFPRAQAREMLKALRTIKKKKTVGKGAGPKSMPQPTSKVQSFEAQEGIC